MIKLLEEIDEMLAAMECVAHGMEGRAITEMRGRIQTELSNSHKHGVSGKQLTYCQCEVPTGRTVTEDFENQICDSCGRLVACAKTKGG